MAPPQNLPDYDIEQANGSLYTDIKTPELKHRASMDVSGVSLSWKNIDLEVTVKKNKKKTQKQILKGINGHANPGQLVVIMGPSGAGKSSLLDCISNRNPNYTGELAMNGQPWKDDYSKLSTYVMQDDVFYANLTVKEHLMIQASLRMPKSVSQEEKEAHVTRVMAELGLTKSKDTMIGGGFVRGISGGERKRLSLATELLTNPQLLLVDEPTSGLDSAMALSVVESLKKLAQSGRTVIATIHQPSSEIFNLFDQLILLADGRIAYFGPREESIDYFASIGYQVPQFTNPADYFMMQLATLDDSETDKKRVKKLLDSWESNEKDQVQTKAVSKDLDLSAMGVVKKSFGTQSAILGKRNILRLLRDKMGTGVRIGMNLFFGVLVGILYWQTGNTQKDVQNISGALFFMTVNQVFGTASGEFNTVPMDLPILSRELSSRLYSPAAWYLAKTVSEFPFQLVWPWIFIVPSYFMVGFGASASMFFTFIGVALLVSNCANGLGYMVSCITKKSELASMLGPVIILPFLLFGGLFLNNDSAPQWLVWLQYLSPIKYGYAALMTTYWKDHGPIECNDPTGLSCAYKDGAQVLDFYSMKMSMATNVLALLGINLLFRLIAFVFVLKLDKDIRKGKN
jgi:ABC-type multidrug transport system ATPase subunit